MDGQNGTAETPPEESGLWISISEIARRKRVEKSSISRRVARLEASGFDEVRISGGKKLINIAAFDKAVGETTDEVREANGIQRGGGATPRRGSGLAAEQTRKTAYQAEMARLDLGEREGKLLPIENVANAAARAGETMVKILNRLPSRADEITATALKDGRQAVRALLKDFVHNICEQIAVDLQRVAAQPEPPELTGWPKLPERLAMLAAETKSLFDAIAEAAP